MNNNWNDGFGGQPWERGQQLRNGPTLGAPPPSHPHPPSYPPPRPPVAPSGGRPGLRPRTLAVVGGLVVVLLVLLALNTLQPVWRQVPPPDPVAVVPGQRVLPEVFAADAPGRYSYLQTNADGSPVRYDPCRPIEYWINPALMPRGGESAIHASARTISEHSGLAFQYRGTTTATPDEWPAEHDGQAVLIVWGTGATDPDLDEDTLGYAGSVRRGVEGDTVYVYGRVVLDADKLDVMPLRRQHAIESVTTHELAHVVGLGHVEDERQLMAPVYDLRPGLGEGDRAGLARIGAGGCHS